MGITADSINQVRAATRIEDIVAADVTLKPGGVDSLKGLCPFHDEKTPSFHVRPSLGRWHCFGCDEGGDVFSYLMKKHAMTFVEAVEDLAAKAGITLTYDTTRNEPQGPTLARLRAANETAEDLFFTLIGDLDNPEAAHARAFIDARHLPPSLAANQWGAGYAPANPTTLITHLHDAGFTDEEITAAGLAAPTTSGTLRPTFRGRLTWPITDPSGNIIAFGARRLDAVSTWGPKFLNTPATRLYKKDQTLFGLDHARTAIRTKHTAHVVEGYTDVIAAHHAGVDTTVAACGTALTVDHVTALHRLVGDDGLIVICLDGDEAGLKAAARALNLTQAVGHLRTHVVTLPDGADPNDILISRGPTALADLMNRTRPLIDLVIDRTIAASPAATPGATTEDRLAARNQLTPILSAITDPTLRDHYARTTATRLNLPDTALTGALTTPSPAHPTPTPYPQGAGAGERDLVAALIADPDTLTAATRRGLTPQVMRTRAGRTLTAAALAALDDSTGTDWPTRIAAHLDDDDTDLLWATLFESTTLTGADLWAALDRAVTAHKATTLAAAALDATDSTDLDALAATRATLLADGTL